MISSIGSYISTLSQGKQLGTRKGCPYSIFAFVGIHGYPWLQVTVAYPISPKSPRRSIHLASSRTGTTERAATITITQSASGS